MDCQRDLFDLDNSVHYCNCAAYSPTPKATMVAGEAALHIKSRPFNITSNMHFEGPLRVREKLGQVIGESDPDRIALFPSVSYGMATVAKNLHRIPNITAKKNIIILDEEFPNNNYAFEKAASSLHLTIRSIPKPSCDLEDIGAQWSKTLIEAINSETAMVVIPHVHWIYGVVFDLEGVSHVCHQVGSLLIIDGTQSVGMLPLDIRVVKPDAVIIAAYKWMLGPYSIGFGYFGPFFDDGVPLEETWMNRVASDDFPRLLDLQSEYRPKAQRYNMGEFSNFILLSMLEASVDLILRFGIAEMYEYAGRIGDVAVQVDNLCIHANLVNSYYV